MKNDHRSSSHALSRTILAAGLILISNLMSLNIAAATSLSPVVIDALNNNKGAEPVILVFLKERANLTQTEHFSLKEEKTKYVHDQLLEVANRTQSELVKYLDGKKLFYKRFYITNAIAVYSPTMEVVKELAARPEVEKISLDPNIKMSDPIVAPQTIQKTSRRGIEAALVSIGVDKVWKEFNVTGKGIILASQDTGIQFDHPALARQYRGAKADGTVNHDYNWYDAIVRRTNVKSENSCGYDTKSPCDDGSHGTHTLGTMLGDDRAGNQVGLAPDAQWVACRNMDDGDGRPSLYIDCFQFFMAPYPIGGDAFKDGDVSKAVDIINNSWGCPDTEGCGGWEMDEVLKAMKAAGILVVVSAGNEGPDCGTMKDQPSSHGASVLSVGAWDYRMDRIASFSSRGPTTFDHQIGPDVVAPGVGIRSAVPGGGYEGGWMGTSMAGPHVAGLAALLWSADQSLIGQIDRTIEIIRSTATPKETTQECGGISGKAIPNAVFGHGVINAYEAVRKVVKN